MAERQRKNAENNIFSIIVIRHSSSPLSSHARKIAISHSFLITRHGSDQLIHLFISPSYSFTSFVILDLSNNLRLSALHSTLTLIRVRLVIRVATGIALSLGTHAVGVSIHHFTLLHVVSFAT